MGIVARTVYVVVMSRIQERDANPHSDSLLRNDYCTTTISPTKARQEAVVGRGINNKQYSTHLI